MLILGSLEKAIASLETVLEARETNPDDLFIRDAAIQRFKYTYELSHKMLKRFLEATSASPSDIDSLSFQD
ncbi:MAG: nucleotidyltransferase substrate binding protein, partial [Alphaproteobacteria bacterium]|nr:nucleotidyltransferase substrate binding protein [Alphaproteobacteria bacterium]